METGTTGLRLPGALTASVEEALAAALAGRWAERLWARDTTLWTEDPEVAARIAHRLGWLDAPEHFRDEVAELEAFAETVRGAGMTDLLVCGMGGSSLAPEVLASVLPRAREGLRVHVLDSTDPAAVLAVDRGLDPARTIRAIATKSGTTTETLAFLAHFWQAEQHRVGRIPASAAGLGFVAITDPDPSLAAIPHADLFREVFLNPADIGGRYSALSYVGLVPAALQGLDLAALLSDAVGMAARCRLDDGANPGVTLGVAIGALALAGRDKLTLVIEPALAPLGAWLEQLIAESTGKEGKGIVPVDGEPLGAPAVYGSDRVFVRLGRMTPSAWRTETDARLAELSAAGHPVIDLPLEERHWVAGEFVRWEVATAIAGAVLGVNPFDEPDVTGSKQNTAAVLAGYARDGHLPAEEPLARSGMLALSGDPGLALGDGGADPVAILRHHLGRAEGDGYHAICAYLAPGTERTASLRALQALLRDGTQRATTLGTGPRFLHSTGQLHKGGRPVGAFLQLVAGHPEDLPIPGRTESFGVLVDAQSLGDLASLRAHGRPVLRVDLGPDPDAGLAELIALVRAALG